LLISFVSCASCFKISFHLQSILEGEEAFAAYVRTFLAGQFPRGDVPVLVVDALEEAGVTVTTTLERPAAEVVTAI
jgi:hypothetical protein